MTITTAKLKKTTASLSLLLYCWMILPTSGGVEGVLGMAKIAGIIMSIITVAKAKRRIWKPPAMPTLSNSRELAVMLTTLPACRNIAPPA